MEKITPGAVVQGGGSLDYHTGSWRYQRPVIDAALCKICGICHDVCPDNAVFVQVKLYQINYLYCKGCGLCAHECPVDAINMTTEEK